MKPIALLILLATGAPALTVRVESPDDSPRIVVNGKPVRARMFYGAPGAAPIPVPADWQESGFDFVAPGDADNGTLHFRFGHQAGTVELRDIKLNGVVVGDWTVWPPDMAGAVARSGGTIQVRVPPPADGERPDFHIYSKPGLVIRRGQLYHVTFGARATPARPLTVALYRPGQQYVRLGGPGDVFASQIKLAAGAGVNFVSFPVGLPWPKPGQAADWTDVDAACETVLAANPDALLLPRIPMDPPPWWREAFPDDVMQWEDGRRDKAVVASPRFRRDAAGRLAALVGHLEEKFGDHVAGYHPVGQNTGEWFYQDTWRQPLSGYAPADLAAWQKWAGREIPLPTPAERRSTEIFATPPLVDWARFQQQAMADCVCELARAAREASGGRKLVMFFYGYVFEFGPVANGPATSGHYALRRVLDCPDIDVLCSPISYCDRGTGGGAPSMTAAESVALTGKMWLSEDDTHTHLATGDQPGSRQHVDTPEETNALLVRNVAQESMRNFATWWMDLGATGWFNDQGMWRQMTRLGGLDEHFLAHPTPFRPEVAAVIDEEAMLRIAPGGHPASRASVYEGRIALGRMGAPYGQYLLDDVLAGRVQARLFVFLNAWCLPPDERARVQQIIRERGRGAVLLVDEKGPTSESLRQAARAAGVHLFTGTDCNVYANGPFVAVHASQDGPLVIDTGADGPVTDVLTGEVVGTGPKLTLPIKRGETRILQRK